MLRVIDCVLSIPECFEKKRLVAFDFDEKLTQSIAQITIFTKTSNDLKPPETS